MRLVAVTFVALLIGTMLVAVAHDRTAGSRFNHQNTQHSNNPREAPP